MVCEAKPGRRVVAATAVGAANVDVAMLGVEKAVRRLEATVVGAAIVGAATRDTVGAAILGAAIFGEAKPVANLVEPGR
jgi:hypothetical protein